MESSVVTLSSFLLLLQMNSKHSMQGCRRTIISTRLPSSTCGPWTTHSSGDTSSWRTACRPSHDEPKESSLSSSVSAKDVTNTPRSIYPESGEESSINLHLNSHTAVKCILISTAYTTVYKIYECKMSYIHFCPKLLYSKSQ